MEHIFIVNPVAGHGKAQKNLIDELRDRRLDFYVTTHAGDGERYIRERCEADPQQRRFYACGGDGTLNEVVNGVAGLDGVEVGCVPAGSGNDFIRNFDRPSGHFRDIDRQLAGQAVSVDLIRYTTTAARAQTVRYAANMFNIGFDCAVVDMMTKVKRYPLAKGSVGYLLSIALVLIKKEAVNLIVEFDDGARHEGGALMMAIANGCFCGGGLKGMPRALLDDGLIDTSVVNNVSRRTCVTLLPKFAKGTHLTDPIGLREIAYRTCERLSVKSPSGFIRLCADGEAGTVEEVTFEIAKDMLRFSVPAADRQG